METLNEICTALIPDLLPLKRTSSFRIITSFHFNDSLSKPSGLPLFSSFLCSKNNNTHIINLLVLLLEREVDGHEEQELDRRKVKKAVTACSSVSHYFARVFALVFKIWVELA